MHDSCFGVTVKECVSFVGAVLKGGNHFFDSRVSLL